MWKVGEEIIFTAHNAKTGPHRRFAFGLVLNRKYIVSEVLPFQRICIVCGERTPGIRVNGGYYKRKRDGSCFRAFKKPIDFRELLKEQITFEEPKVKVKVKSKDKELTDG